MLEQLAGCNARLDILHFEQLTASFGEDDDEEFLGHSSLLGVAEAVAQLVGGVVMTPVPVLCLIFC